MAYKSYREFLERLEKAGELTRIASPTASELEITEIADREMKKPGGGSRRAFACHLVKLSRDAVTASARGPAGARPE